MATIINASTSAGLIQTADTSGILAFQTNGTETARIDSSGNVGIGTSSPGTKLNVYTGSATNTLIRAQNTAGYIDFGALSTGAVYGGYSTGGYYTLGTSDANPIVFFSNGSERARIDSSGNLLVGYTSSNGSYKLQVNSQIFATSSTIATSDVKYKENIVALDGALSLITALNPVQFSWKEHSVHNFDRAQPTIGFIAQEVQQVLANKTYLNSVVKRNECVISEEEKDENGNITKPAVTEEFLGIAEGNMIALLTKAIQELNAIITAQAADIAALKTKVGM